MLKLTSKNKVIIGATLFVTVFCTNSGMCNQSSTQIISSVQARVQQNITEPVTSRGQIVMQVQREVMKFTPKELEAVLRNVPGAPDVIQKKSAPKTAIQDKSVASSQKRMRVRRSDNLQGTLSETCSNKESDNLIKVQSREISREQGESIAVNYILNNM